MWRALGIMTASGSLRNAALLLRELKMPDSAAAFCAACKEAGFHSPFAPIDAGQGPSVKTSPTPQAALLSCRLEFSFTMVAQ